MQPARSIFLAVAPNGARKTKADHPMLPLTGAELAACARSCRDAGASMIHLHVRDDGGRHSLDIGLYQNAMQAIRDEVGDSLVIQMTSEAVGRYGPHEQMAMVRGLRPEAVSMAVRELFSGDVPEPEVAAFLAECQQQRIVIQFILYDDADVLKYVALRRRGVIAKQRHWVLFVLGRYAGGQSTFEDLLPMHSAWRVACEVTEDVPWAICAFGARECECAMAAAALGGHVRIGFENNLLLPDGRMARDNAELIGSFAEVARLLGHRLFTADEMRARFP